MVLVLYVSCCFIYWDGAIMSEWINVKDKLPKNICCILAYGNGMIYFAFYNSVGNFCLDNEFIENITHWMPLPKPPKDQS